MERDTDNTGEKIFDSMRSLKGKDEGAPKEYGGGLILGYRVGQEQD